MNAVEIEEALSALALEPFDGTEFPYAFLAALGNKGTTLKRLRKGDSNASDVAGGVLQRSNIHLAVCAPGAVGATLDLLKASPKTAQAKAKIVLATDGAWLEAEDLTSGEHIAGDFTNFPDHFGFFLPLAGISTVKEIKDNPIDVRATGRLNKLYVELLRENTDWAKEARRHDMNHFMARLVFCFFAEDTDIFQGADLFTQTLQKMSESDGSNTHEVLETIFGAMNIPAKDRAAARVPRWAAEFPYVNGGLFSGNTDVPRFTRTARAYLLRAGDLNWKEINPDIFGSMIQAVADDEERGALGMHYTSVPNILKVLNPLFLDDLRGQLDASGDNKAKLLNLRKRLARIRVFDPACGSGNFLVIAYKQMRAIEAQINQRRGEANLKSEIPLTNFRGIELRDFPAEIARLSLIIAEFQSDVLYRGQQEALSAVLPLDSQNWITCGNALRMDWLAICPPTGTGVKLVGDDLFNTPLDQSEIDFENEGGETYICGNPPYKGARKQESQEKADLEVVYRCHPDFKDADYVTGWFLKGAEYCEATGARFALVATSSVCQGEQVQFVWPRMWKRNLELYFGYSPFKWSNNATKNAGVFVTIVGIRPRASEVKILFDEMQQRVVENISPYLIAGPDVFVASAGVPISVGLPKMVMGNMARDDGNLILSSDEARQMFNQYPEANRFLTPLLGTKEIVDGVPRYALHLHLDDEAKWSAIPPIAARVNAVKDFRQKSKAKTTNGYASVPFRFAQYCHRDELALAFPSVTPEERTYVTPILLREGVMVTNLAYLVYGFGMELLAVAASRMHVVWVRAVSGRLGSGVRYTPSISYHTFPVPALTEQNKADLMACANDILLAREAHFPASIADLYTLSADEQDQMPDDLRRAHEKNDETLERIYIGRRFKNDTERLEKLFDLYTKMAAKPKKWSRAG